MPDHKSSVIDKLDLERVQGILLVGDDPESGTGYAHITRAWLEFLGNAPEFEGRKIHLGCRNATNGLKHITPQLDVFGISSHVPQKGNVDDFLTCARESDLLVYTGEIQWMGDTVHLMRENGIGSPVIAHVPIDHGDLSSYYVAALNYADILVPFSQLTADRATTNGFKGRITKHIYPPIRWDVFTRHEKVQELREQAHLDNEDILLSTVSLAQDRKYTASLMRVMSKLMLEEPRLKWLLHTPRLYLNPSGMDPKGLFNYVYDSTLHPDIRDRVILPCTGDTPDKGMDYVACIYNISDGHVLFSTSEGYGYPAYETAGCGLVGLFGDLPEYHELLENKHTYVEPDDHCFSTHSGCLRPVWLERTIEAAIREYLQPLKYNRDYYKRRALDMDITAQTSVEAFNTRLQQVLTDLAA